ncbi:MAG: hypothetical protein ACJ78Y_09235, partial [Myxococcales bacterium]
MKASSISVTLLALAACGGTRDVAGQVVSGFDRTPVAGAKVRIGNKAIVTTGTDGRFAVQSVDTPYDVAVATPDGASAAVYEGLTRADPVVLISSNAGQSQSIGTVIGESATGKLTGAVPLADGSRIQALFTGPSNASASTCCGSVSSDGTYTMPLSWTGDAKSFTGTLRVVVFRVDAGNVPVSFD